jgi:hypothetical protein
LLLLAGTVAVALLRPGRPQPGGGETFADQTRRDEARLDAMMRRIRAAAASGAWREPGWRDPVIESGLDGLLDEVGRTARRPELALPVRLGKVRPARPPDRGAAGLDHALCVLKDDRATVPIVRRSILLVDGNVRIMRAEDSVIVGRGAVEIAFGQRNVVVAGHFLHVGYDGDYRRDWRRPIPLDERATVLVSGSAGWRVSGIDRGFVLLSNGGEDAEFYLPDLAE